MLQVLVSTLIVYTITGTAHSQLNPITRNVPQPHERFKAMFETAFNLPFSPSLATALEWLAMTFQFHILK